MLINVLGTEYTIRETDEHTENRLCDCDGFCDKTTKEICITTAPKECSLGNWAWYRNKILRHEIIHAFFFESGFHENFKTEQWGVSETLVDWFAVQFPKIKKVFDELEI